MNDNETIADVIAAMRDDATTRDQFDSAYIVDFCDRLEAAHKRETKELRVEIERLKEERNYSGVRERERLRAKGFAIVPKEQLERGDCAKLREALVKARRFIDSSPLVSIVDDTGTIARGELCAEIDAALAAQPRNCEKYTTADEAMCNYADEALIEEWNALKAGKDRDMLAEELFVFTKWLFAPATEGGNNGC